MSGVREYRWWRGAVRPTLAISVCATVVTAGLLYGILDRHDRAAAQHTAEASARATEQRVVDAAGIFAAAAKAVMLSDMSRVQDLVAAFDRTGGWQEAMVVSRDAIVLAAMQSGQVGQKIPDGTWASWQRGSRLVARRATDQQGNPVFVVVVPVKDGDDVVASVMLVTALPAAAPPPQIPSDLVREAGVLLPPVFLFFLAIIGLAMKLATGAMRKQIRALMAEVLGPPSDPEIVAPKAG